jgi:hypothetical protein
LVDLESLAAYDLADRSEEDIRGDWIDPLLRLLGYGLGTRHRIRRDLPLRIRPMIGSRRLEIDFIPTVFGHRLWIIEAKRPQSDLFAPDHLDQAWSYAMDPRIHASLMVLCDGARLAVFDVSKHDWEEPVFDHPKSELPAHFDELFELFGAPRVAEAIRLRQLSYLREALFAQLEESVLDRTLEDVSAMVEQARPIVAERANSIRQEASEQLEIAGQEAVDAAGMWGFVPMINRPLFFRLVDVDRCVDLVLRQPPELRMREFADLLNGAINSRGEDRMWFPVRSMRLAAAVLLSDQQGCDEACAAIAREEIVQHNREFSDDPMRSEVYRLQRSLGPLGWRLAAASKDEIDRQAAFLVDSMDVEEWLRLDGAIGVEPRDLYLRTAILAPIMYQSTLEPWNLQSVTELADAATELLRLLPKPRGLEQLQPAGDPWLDSWLNSSPLPRLSSAVLSELRDRGVSQNVSELISELMAL